MTPAARPPAGQRVPNRPVITRPVGALVLSNLLGGVGVASSVAVGGLLVERAGGTGVAGFGQAASVLGAALAAIPLARLAARRGRRWSLTTGYAVALVGAATIMVAALLTSLALLLAGLTLFGAAVAANLQSRYAATDGVPAAARARVMSLVIWATTLGTVVGPNLSAVGERLGSRAGLPGLAGPYLFSVVSFAAAGLAVVLLYPRAARAKGLGDDAPDVLANRDGDDAPDVLVTGRSDDAGGQPDRGHGARVRQGAQADDAGPGTVGALAAMHWAVRDPTIRPGLALVVGGQAVMTSVMVMTPLHMQHNGMTLQLVGVVISLHTLGMYAFSPVFGWLTDRHGTAATARTGLIVLAAAVTLGILATGSAGVVTATGLFLLGLGWSACTIAGSTIIASTPTPAVRVPLQGATDAAMNYAGAAAAALAGPVLALAGFRGVNIVAAAVVGGVVAVFVVSGRTAVAVVPELEPEPEPRGPVGAAGDRVPAHPGDTMP